MTGRFWFLRMGMEFSFLLAKYHPPKQNGIIWTYLPIIRKRKWSDCLHLEQPEKSGDIQTGRTMWFCRIRMEIRFVLCSGKLRVNQEADIKKAPVIL